MLFGGPHQAKPMFDSLSQALSRRGRLALVKRHTSELQAYEHRADLGGTREQGVRQLKRAYLDALSLCHRQIELFLCSKAGCCHATTMLECRAHG